MNQAVALDLEYELQPQDVEAWWQFQSRHSRAGRLNYLSTVVIVGGIAAWAGAHFATTALTTVVLGIGGLALGWGLASVGTSFWVRTVSADNVKGHAAQAQFGRHILTVGSDGVSEQGPGGRHSHSWTAVEGLLEGPRHLFVAVGGGGAYVVPKRNVTDEAAALLKAIVVSNTQQRRRTSG